MASANTVSSWRQRPISPPAGSLGTARADGIAWSLTLLATAIHQAWMSAPERLVGVLFVGLGGVAALALPRCGSAPVPHPRC